MTLESEPTIRRGNPATPRDLGGWPIEFERGRKDHVLVEWSQLLVDQGEELPAEEAFEAERVLEWKRSPLPVKPVVHSEERDMLEAESGVVRQVGQHAIVTLGANGNDQRELDSGSSRLGDLVEHFVGKVSIEIGAGFDDRQVERRLGGELVGWDRKPLGYAVGVDGQDGSFRVSG